MKVSRGKGLKITKWKIFALVLLLIGVGILITDSLSVPQYMTVKGTLRNSTGSLLSGTYNLTFRIYNDSGSGILKWTETQEVNVSDGIYYAILGSVISLNVSFDENYWLSLEVDSDGEMAPRQRLTSAPYTLRANQTESLICVDCINDTQISGVSWSKIINEPTNLSQFTDDLLWNSVFNTTGNSKWLTSYTETDPQWTENFTLYNNTWSRDTTINNCSISGACSFITYDSETSGWDKDPSNDLTILTSWNGDLEGSGSSPTVSDDSHLHTKATVTIHADNITEGEITDSRISNDLTISSSNNISSTAGITLGDNINIYFGNSEDIKMYFNGTHFVIEG